MLPSPTWSEAERARYRAAGYWSDETFAQFVATRCTAFAERTAVVGLSAAGEEVRWTYADLLEEASRVASGLRALGVRPGDRVIVALPNVTDYVAVVLGIFRLGALPVFALPTHREVELTQFARIADPAALVGFGPRLQESYDALVRQLEALAPEDRVAPPVLVDLAQHTWAPTGGNPSAERPDVVEAPGAEETAFLQLSGGTTGISKLIPRTAADYLYSVRASAEICGLTCEDVMLVVLPAAHNFAMSSPGILGILHVGGTVVLAPEPSPRTGFALVEREQVTTVALVPPLAQAWISAARRRRPDLTSLRTVQVGGARLNDVIARDVEPVLHGRLQQVFGMAEGLVNYTRTEDPDEVVLSTQGIPISPADEIRVVDATGAEVASGEEGALLTRGPYTIRGYYGAERWVDTVNADAFTADGFYRTGDLVRRLPSGHLVVTGRDKDQINRAGEKIAVEEIEGHLLAHPDVLDAVALGLPDERLGEALCVVVRVEPGRDRPGDLTGYLRAAGLATYKIPDSVVFLDDFPATHVGKNSRRDLRALLAAGLATS